MSNIYDKPTRQFDLCKVLMLKTENASPLVLNLEKTLEYDEVLSNYDDVDQHYLYIVKGYEFKFGDWVINPSGYPDIFGPDFHAQWSRENIFSNTYRIIATTDPTIGNPSNNILKRLPKIPSTFIRKYINEFNKNKTIDNVFVEFYPNGFLKYETNELGIDWDSEEDMTGKPILNEYDFINTKIKIDNNTKDDIFILIEMWEKSKDSSILSFDSWLKINYKK